MIPIKLDEEKCSSCKFCYLTCPFDAISLEDDRKVKIDIEGCQLCGMCSTVCPSSTIDLAYYSYDSLVEKVKKGRDLGVENLVLMCRGAIPSSNDALNVFKGDTAKFISLRLPCIGRIKTEFYLKALTLGIKKIVTVQCIEDFCRYKRGSQLNERRILLLKELLEQFGYEDMLTIIEKPQQIEYDTERCVGCDKCVYVCPYDAIEAKPLATPYIYLDRCRGCGLCTIICPHLAMQIGNFEFERVSSVIKDYSTKVAKLKEKGVSPIVLVFCCQWAEFSALDNLKDGFLRENAAIIEIPCFNTLDPVHVLQALRFGFDGVLAVICSDEECKSGEGRSTAEEGVSILWTTLKRLKLEDRFEVYKTHPRYKSFEEKLGSFLREVESCE